MQQVNYQEKAISSYQEGFMPITYRQNTASANADFLSNPSMPNSTFVNKISQSVNNMKQQPTSMLSNAGSIPVPSEVSYQTGQTYWNVGKNGSMQEDSNVGFKVNFEI